MVQERETILAKDKDKLIEMFTSVDHNDHTLARGILENQYPKYLYGNLKKYSRKELKSEIDKQIIRYYFKSLFEDNGESVIFYISITGPTGSSGHSCDPGISGVVGPSGTTTANTNNVGLTKFGTF